MQVSVLTSATSLEQTQEQEQAEMTWRNVPRLCERRVQRQSREIVECGLRLNLNPERDHFVQRSSVQSPRHRRETNTR